MAKQLYVVGNWKMYKTSREATDYIESLIPLVEGSIVNIYLAIPYTSIAMAANYAKDTNVIIGAQNMNDTREGAFTGEIAGLMLKEAGAAFVLLGHSERRHIFAESDDLINRKVIRALQDDIQPIVCVGETLSDYDGGRTEEVLKSQLVAALAGIPKEDVQKLLVAYEPVWAIGTGKTPTAKQIQQVHAFCRECLSEIFGKKSGGAIPLLYGGSVKPTNVAEIIAGKDVDGTLVGGASLNPETFSLIVQNIAASSAPKKSPKPRIKEEKKE